MKNFSYANRSNTGFLIKGISLLALYASREFWNTFSVARRTSSWAIVFAMCAESSLKQVKNRLDWFASKPYTFRSCHEFSRLPFNCWCAYFFNDCVVRQHWFKRVFGDYVIENYLEKNRVFLFEQLICIFLLILSFGDNIPDNGSPVRHLMAFKIFPVSIKFLNCFPSSNLSFLWVLQSLYCRALASRSSSSRLHWHHDCRRLGNWPVVGRFYQSLNQLGKIAANFNENCL